MMVPIPKLSWLRRSRIQTTSSPVAELMALKEHDDVDSLCGSPGDPATAAADEKLLPLPAPLCCSCKQSRSIDFGGPITKRYKGPLFTVAKLS
jgi:hypothetical protein